jgi:hypothetical protein
MSRQNFYVKSQVSYFIVLPDWKEVTFHYEIIHLQHTSWLVPCALILQKHCQTVLCFTD